MSTTSHTRHSYEHYKSHETFTWALQVTWDIHMSTTSHRRHSHEHYKSHETFIWALQVTRHSHEHYKSHETFIWVLQVTWDIHMSTTSHMRHSYEHYKTHENFLQQESYDSLWQRLLVLTTLHSWRGLIYLSRTYSTSRCSNRTHQHTLIYITSAMPVSGDY